MSVFKVVTQKLKIFLLIYILVYKELTDTDIPFGVYGDLLF